MTDQNQYISHADLVEVVTYISLDRNDSFKDRISRLSICEVSQEHIVFGILRVQGRLSISWKRYLAIKQLLDKSFN